ncbi:MAG: hypothetical protein A2Y92_04020, partial [Chloroflexi bacterium RBG_13_57_8]
MTEAELQQSIIDAAAKLGYGHYHTHDSRRSDYGWPDLVLIHEGKRRVLFIEVKSSGGRVTPAQVVRLDALARCGQEVYIVRPEEYEEIIEVLMLGEKPGFA